MNALAGENVAPLRDFMSGHRTAILLGPSGAGKSTIVNALLGRHRQETGAVRVSDQRGRHTTVARELIALPDGGVLIDTPGLRALGLTGSEEGIALTFSDIDAARRGVPVSGLHTPGRTRAAPSARRSTPERFPQERLTSYQKLMREAEVAAARTDARLRAEEDRKAKTLSKAVKDYFRNHPR